MKVQMKPERISCILNLNFVPAKSSSRITVRRTVAHIRGHLATLNEPELEPLTRAFAGMIKI
jgi:hypothetical protein